MVEKLRKFDREKIILHGIMAPFRYHRPIFVYRNRVFCSAKGDSPIFVASCHKKLGTAPVFSFFLQDAGPAYSL